MAKLTTWSVYSAEGNYIGQTEAYAAQTALTRCLAMKGQSIDESKVIAKPIDEHSFLIEHHTDKFILRSFR
jgi:hypothetical protein